MIVKALAKINLALHITGQREDGYHSLESLVTFADAYDALAFAPSNIDELNLCGPFVSALSGDNSTNLVAQARDLLRKLARSRQCPPVAITLEKNLPISSGIGGGSADAAATLKGLNALWELGLSIGELAEIGLSLGADVPMCIHARPLIAKGIGENIEPVEVPPFHLLLVNPGVAVSTPAIFRALIKKENDALPPPSLVDKDLSGFLTYLATSRNDLQSAAIITQPAIADVLRALEKSGALFVRMSGSGATCFGVFADLSAKNIARAAIADAHPNWWIG